MTYNIRYDDPDNKVYDWDQRKRQITNLIQFYEPVFIGTQEGLLHQLKYLQQNLGSFKWIGDGRNGGNKGEFSALFYDSTKVTLIDSDSTIWLSETPSKPSMDWDATFPRILTYGKFQNRVSGNEFFVFNTHFDHKGETARRKSTSLIVEKYQKLPGIITSL